MPFKYNKLFALLVMKGLNGTDLRGMTGISAPTMAKLSKGEPVNTRVLAKICKALECNVEDIMEYIPDQKD